MMQAFNSRAAMGLLAIICFTAACDGSTCDDRECVSTVKIEIEGALGPETEVVFESSTETVTCSPTLGMGGLTSRVDFECDDSSVLWLGEGTFSLRNDPETLTVRVLEQGDVTKEVMFTPEYVEESQKCHPGCRHGEVTMTLE